MERTIFHIDVNSAFLSWEAAKRIQQGILPDLRTLPSAIAGSSLSRRGIILAKSVPAKAYGILTGEPVVSAKQKCPQLICIPPDYPFYSKMSQKLFDLLGQYSDRLEEFSIDECFLDFTGMEQLFGNPFSAAQHIQEHIWKELGFTVNIGISHNKLLAKMAGELEKPNKIHTLYPEEIPKKLWPLPVEELFMVGRRTAPRLKNMNIHTIGELAHFDLTLLQQELKSYGKLLHAYANGIENSPVALAGTPHTPKSISNSTTTTFDVTDHESAYQVLLALSESVGTRLRQHQLAAQEIAVTMKSFDFKVYTRQRKLLSPIDCTNAIYHAAKEIFSDTWKGEPLRLLGVRAAQLCPEQCAQLSLLETDWEKQKRAEEAIDTLRLKYGKNIVMRSTLLHTNKKTHGGSLQINNHIFH